MDLIYYYWHIHTNSIGYVFLNSLFIYNLSIIATLSHFNARFLNKRKKVIYT